MLEGRKVAFINDYGIDLENEGRGHRAFDIHGGIVLMVVGDAEIHGSHNISLSNMSEDPSRGAFIADVLSLPLGLEVERMPDLSKYTKLDGEADKQRLLTLLKVRRWSDMCYEVGLYPNHYIEGVYRSGEPHKVSTATDLVRAIQTSRHTFIKIPESLISPEQENAHMAFLRRLVQYQLANVAKLLNSARNGGLAYDKALAPLMDFIELYELENKMPRGHDIFFEQYDLSEEEYQKRQADNPRLRDHPSEDEHLEPGDDDDLLLDDNKLDQLLDEAIEEVESELSSDAE